MSGLGGSGFKTQTKIIVEISAKESLTIEGISLLLNTGARRIKPMSLKKTIIPEPRALFISGNKIENCFKISSNFPPIN